MWLHIIPMLRKLLCPCALACVAMLTMGCSTVVGPYTPTTSVTPLATDDLSGPCKFEMILSGPDIPQTGVLVIYERADSSSLYTDPAVRAMAAQLRLAMVFAYQCNAASYDDLQSDATKGPGRALFLALSQFATLTDHPELANANVFLSGFSLAGYLGMSMTNAYPNRILGAILYAPASAYSNMNDLAVTPAAGQIPMLILANGADVDAGTQRPFNLFARGAAFGGPWGFGVQNATGHCCTDTTRNLMIPWVTAILQQFTAAGATGVAVLRPIAAPAPPTVQFSCIFDGFIDVLGEADCSVRDPSILPASAGGQISAWLPDSATANAWLSWVTNPGPN